MSKYTNYDEKHFAQIFDREMQVIGADVIAGLLHVHCGKSLQDLHVLDAGCGTGRFAKALIDLGVGKMSLLDASPEMLNLAKEKLKYSMESNIIDQVIEAVLPNLPFTEGTFDAVMYNYVLQDLEKPEDKKEVPIMETVLHNTKKILRPKGVLVITTGLPSTIKESIWYTQLHQPIADKLAKYFPSTREWLDLFIKCGFECVSAMNFLKSDKVNHFDHEGPLREEWLLGTCVYASADDQEKKALDQTIMELKEKGLLKQFMDEHDRTLEMGMTTLFVCISV